MLEPVVSPSDPPYTPAPPPWTLEGNGVVVLYRRPDAALLERWIPADWQKDYVGGPAALMLVDYLHSDAG
ncbi:MAG: hypothetical protein R3200_17805, partial [Xanthomonadales bacterium]|nr:hypothetical protein [Xanthomonadales bacterium]